MAKVVLRATETAVGQNAGSYVGTLHRLFNNDSGDIQRNGEAWLMSQLGSNPSIVFDVGANRGSWTREALHRLPNATVHAFEPIPETFGHLAQALGDSPRVRINRLALSDRTRNDLKMWIEASDGTMSSATSRISETSAEVVVPSMTGDEYIRASEIRQVDLLKIDVEGHELQVLTGFSQALADGRVDLVQFEFTLWSAIARRWLADYYEYFSQWDFRIGKLWPRSVRWKDYSAEDEQFFRCNYVAVRRGSSAARLLRAD